MLQINEMIAALAQSDPDARRAALEELLCTAKLPYTIQKGQHNPKKLCVSENFLVKIGDPQDPCVLFCAHYDAVHGSCGANDNAAAVCVLISLATALNERGIPAEFAFFDGEESGRGGSKLYARELDKKSVTAVVNVDLCGYGDTIAMLSKGSGRKNAVHGFYSKEILKKYSVTAVKYLPESDDASFSGLQIPIISLAVVPRWDVQFLNALASYGGGLLGRPPEFEQMQQQMEITTTMHGGFRDTVESIQPEATELMYNYLLEAVTAPKQQKTSIFSKIRT